MNFELLVEWINTEWHLLLLKCFSLLCNKTSVKNDTSRFVCHPLDCVFFQRPSLNLQQQQKSLNGLLVPVVHMSDSGPFLEDPCWISWSASRSYRVSGTLWGDTQRLVAPRQLWPRGFSVVPQDSGGFSRQ